MLLDLWLARLDRLTSSNEKVQAFNCVTKGLRNFVKISEHQRVYLTSKIATLTSFNMKGPRKMASTISVQSAADVDKFNQIRIWMEQLVCTIESFETGTNRTSIEHSVIPLR